MAKAKTKNYTEKQTAELVAAYAAATTDAEREQVKADFADKLGKTKRSIVAKLSREMGADYIGKSYRTKTGEKPQKKESIRDAIAEMLNLPAESLAGLEKASKKPLQRIADALTDTADENS